jgi:hypothetical protein
MFDASPATNGKVDRVTASFSETLAASTATAPWTLGNVPSNGSLASVATSGPTATLTLTEGAGAANTAVGSFTVALTQNVTGIRDAAGNGSSFAATAPADKAAPVPTGIAFPVVGSLPSRFQQNDELAVVFSENVATSASSSNVSVSRTGGTTTMTAPNVFASPVTISTSHISNGETANFTGSAVTAAGATVTLKLASTTSTQLGNGATSTFTYTPATTISDGLGNQAAGSFAFSGVLF